MRTLLGEKKKVFLVLDIGGETVKILLFKKERERSLVFGSGLLYFRDFGKFESFTLDKKTVETAVLRAISEARSMAEGKISGVFLGLTEDFLKFREQVVTHERKDAGKITEKESKLILSKAIERGKKDILEEFSAETGILSKDIEFQKLEVSEIYIDGYRKMSLKGAAGRSIQLKVSAIFGLKEYLNWFKSIVERNGLKIIKTGSQTEALEENLGKKIENCIFVDVGGETTQVVFVNKGRVEEVGSFSGGGNNFSRAIAKQLGISQEEARVLKEKYSKKELPVEIKNHIDDIVSEEMGKWFWGLKRSLLEKHTILPEDIFLAGGASQMWNMPEKLSEADWTFLPETDRQGEAQNSRRFSPRINFISPKALGFDRVPAQSDNPQFISSFLLTFLEH